jgi:hypothetical protein
MLNHGPSQKDFEPIMTAGTQNLMDSVGSTGILVICTLGRLEQATSNNISNSAYFQSHLPRRKYVPLTLITVPKTPQRKTEQEPHALEQQKGQLYL